MKKGTSTQHNILKIIKHSTTRSKLEVTKLENTVTELQYSQTRKRKYTNKTIGETSIINTKNTKNSEND